MNKDFLSIDGNAKKNQREALTPYKIAVVMFIQAYCSESRRIVPNPIIEKRDFCIAALKLIQSPDLDVNDFFKLIMAPEYAISRLKLLVEMQMKLLNKEGVKSLLDLFDDLGSLMKPTTIIDPHTALLSKHSVLGLYVRRIIILFEKLTFCKIVSLYEAFQSYVNDLEDENLMENSEKEQSLHNNNAWGGRQAELLVAQQAHALLTDEHKALPPAELQALVKDLLNSSPYYAEAHYLSYLNCLRVNEYCGALDSLYHCFDRLAPVENKTSTDDKLRTFRYAALNLAALHAQFGYKELAQLALKEAITLAQEAGDNVCLQLAHSWVYYLTDKNKGPLIERSIAKANALGMTHTTSLALIASAHNSALEGKKPQLVFETLTKSDVLNNQHSMTDLMSMIYAEKTALWAYYGKTEMSSVCAQLLLLFNSGEKKQVIFNGPSTCQAAVTVANILNELGEFNLAGAVLSHAKERFPNQPSSRIWALSEQLHDFMKLMRNEKWTAAKEIALQMSNLDSLESKFRLVEVYLAKHNFPEAITLTHEIEEMEDITPQQRVRVKLLMSQIQCCSINAGSPQSAASSILLLNSALEIATANHLSYYKALVNLHIVNIQLLLELPFQALSIIRESIIHILAHGSLYDQGRAHVTYAKCLSANAYNQTKENKKYMILEAINHLNKAKKLFNKLEANDRLKSTIYLLSVYYNEINMKEERNKCAFEFRQLNQQFPTEKNHLFLF